jgi:hypothetical protein
MEIIEITLSAVLNRCYFIYALPAFAVSGQEKGKPLPGFMSADEANEQAI